LKDQVTADGVGSSLTQFVVVIIGTGIISVAGDYKNGSFSSDVTLEVAHKAVNLSLRLRRQICRIESEIGAVLHIDDDFTFQTKISDGIEGFFRLCVNLPQSSLELAELPFDSAHPAA